MCMGAVSAFSEMITAPWGMQGSTITPGETDSQRFIRALQKLENSAGRYSPGSLLLAQDPNDLNRSAFHYLPLYAPPISCSWELYLNFALGYAAQLDLCATQTSHEHPFTWGMFQRRRFPKKQSPGCLQ